MPIPDNHRKIVEEIMFAASRIRGMAHSELGHWGEAFERIMDDLFPYNSSNNMQDSPIIEACGRYLDYPTASGFMNIVQAAKRDASIVMYLKIYMEMELPEFSLDWIVGNEEIESV